MVPPRLSHAPSVQLVATTVLATQPKSMRLLTELNESECEPRIFQGVELADSDAVVAVSIGTTATPRHGAEMTTAADRNRATCPRRIWPLFPFRAAARLDRVQP